MKAAARRLRRHQTAWLLALAATVAALVALLVPLALADIVEDTVAAPAPGQYGARAPTKPRHAAHRRVDAPRGAPAAPARATVTIAPDAASKPVPPSFLGISTEYWALPLFERNTPALERVLALLHVPGDAPLILRIGGDSADHAFWSARRRRLPEWAFELTPAYLERLAALVRRGRVRLIVDLNLLTDTSLTAAAWARAAETSLPHGSIAAFEIGNEPDLYNRRYWVATVARSPLVTRPMPLAVTPGTYVQNFAGYARVLAASAPDIPLVGPAVAHPHTGLPFISELIRDERPELGMVTGHLYPYSKCVKNPRSASYPTVARLLGRRATAAFATNIAGAVALAHRAGLRFRLTEFNSVTCGGKAGVSDSFATALWAPDALFTAMRAGVDAADLHVRADTVNAAFTIDRRGLQPRPLLYGLMLFTRTLGPQARLVRLHLNAAQSLDLSAWAVEIRGDILHVLLIDKGRRNVRVDVRALATGAATVQRLLAPSPYARTGVSLNGQQLNYAGDWTGSPRTEMVIATGRGGYELTLARRSAALVTIRLARRSEHHGGIAVTQHPVLAVGLNRSRQD